MSGTLDSPSMSSRTPAVTVGIIVIGDEILKGHTQDTNSYFLCKRLFSLGVKVHKISVIADDIESIADEVNKFSNAYSYVITSGGVGPTHDDLTHLGVAKAFGEEVHQHPDIVSTCKFYFQTETLTPAQLKLCTVARSAHLIKVTSPMTGRLSKFPVVTVRNVFVFPGIPSLLHKAFDAVEHVFTQSLTKFNTEFMYLNMDELQVADALEKLANKYKDIIVIGSYPVIGHSYYKVKVVLESEDNTIVQRAYRELSETLPTGALVSYDTDPVCNAVERVYSITQTNSDDSVYLSNVQIAIDVVEDALSRYSLDQISLCFNGGKDCTVLLHLLCAVIKHKYPETTTQINALYIRSRQPFPEVEKFIEISCDRYNLALTRLNGRIKDCLYTYQRDFPSVKAIVMGQRQTDPRSNNLEAFTPTDPDWPTFMRVNPLLHWRYEDVWKFLRSLSLPYCSLYDKGYTSLGSMNDTHPNPSLQYIDNIGVLRYFPAYKLSQASQERDGRS